MAWAQRADVQRDIPPAGTATPIGPPTGILSAAALAAGAAWVLVFFPGQSVRIAGWALGSLITVGLVTRYTVVDAKRSESPWYAWRPSLARVRWMVAAAGAVAAAAHTFAFATKVAS